MPLGEQREERGGARSPRDEVLVTGYPSFLARRVTEHLLAVEPRTIVHAVVRPRAAEEAKFALAALDPQQRARVEVHEGDAAAMDMRLAGTEYLALAKKLRRIYHCAHVGHFGAERSAAEHANIEGTREALQLARACASLECLVHYSTTAVAGDRTGLIREEELERGQRFRDVVQETRARAEKLVRAAQGELPAVVVRPSILVGDSRTGEVDKLDGPYLLFAILLTSPPDLALPLPGDCEQPLHLVPVDHVARASHQLSRDPRALGRTFHIVDPHPLTARRVFEAVARAAGRRSPKGSIPANLAKALLRTPGLDRFARSPRAFLDTLVTEVTYDAAGADALLAEASIVCPPFDSYVERLVEHVQHKLRERRTRRAEEPSDGDVRDPLL
jgi:thioester reductase-like protein